LPEELQPTLTDQLSLLAIKAWNLMGKKIDWAGMDTICDMLGIQDIELLINQFEILRDYG